jgi:hypothetical protein
LFANPSRAIYGTIVATAIIAATSSHDNNAGHVAFAVFVTLLVFWLAHVYTGVLEHGLQHGLMDRSVVRTVMVEEIVMVEAPLLSIAILLLGAAGWIGDQLAINLALANGVIQLLLWGIAVARRLGRSWPFALLSGLVDASFGLVVVALKVLVH